MSEMEKMEVELINEINEEQGLSWKKFFNILKLNAIYNESEWL